MDKMDIQLLCEGKTRLCTTMVFLADLTRVKSARACLPLGRRVRASPGRRGRI
jgi:hypothetical protein